MEKWIGALKNVPNEYKSIPFWSWNNFLDEQELQKQIEDMKAAEIGGFIMHARTGLKEEYLGEKWFSCVGACLKKARELGMNAWIYDENGWPSGFVGGKLLENEAFRARYLEYKTGAFDSAAFASFTECAEGYKRVTHDTGARIYHNVYLRVSPANTDILNPAVVDAFLAQTHEQYFARFPESFGHELAGFFTDEPQYYRWGTPYSPCAEEAFRAEGEDVRDGLIWLFVHDERGYAFRRKYYGVLNRLYCENYYKKLYDWCEAHGCMLTGHSVEEGALFAQMYGGAAVTPTYEYEHIPGIDWLGRDCGTALAPKQVASAAAQLGKKFILTETYGCAGYDVTPRELKSIGDFQYFNGVTTMCQHLYPYSLAGRGKTDHPPVFSPHGNWGGSFKAFNEYFNRLGYLIANTKEECDVAVLSPVREIWLDYIRSDDYESVKQIEEAFGELLARLSRNGVTYHLIDETLLAKYGAARGGALAVGKREYRTLIVPPVRSLAAATYRILSGYTGNLLLLGAPCYLDGVKSEINLKSNLTFEQIVENRRVRFSCEDGRSFLTERTDGEKTFLFVKNNSRTEESFVQIGKENLAVFDLETLSLRAVSGELTLRPCEGLVLVADENAPKSGKTHTVDCSNDFAVEQISPNFFVLDYAQLAKGSKPFGERKPLSGIFEGLLREDYKGEIAVKQTFFVKERMPLTLIAERGAKAVTVNGARAEMLQSAFDVNFLQADITDSVREGENIIIFSYSFAQHEGVRFALFDPEATESLRNCLYYDVSLENAYLKGDFIVNGKGELEKPRKAIELGSDLYQKGYPFFKGEYTLRGKVFWNGRGKAALKVQGRYHVAELFVNGNYSPLVLDEKRDITEFLKKGENEVVVVVRSSLRNLFGPHHFRPEPEPMGVSPYHFELRGCWEGERLPCDYTHTYHSVPFGAEKILLVCEDTEA